MSKLQLHGRPFIVFNAKNKDHRQWFAEFQRSATWGHCPVRFVVDNDHGDLITMIQRHLIQYYVDKEFGTQNDPKLRVSKKQQDRVAQNDQKVVDIKPKR
jgi:hypothetical protein